MRARADVERSKKLDARYGSLRATPGEYGRCIYFPAHTREYRDFRIVCWQEPNEEVSEVAKSTKICSSGNAKTSSPIEKR